MNFGIYLANLFTFANLGCGLFSIIQTIQGDFIFASWLILMSIVFDGFDGPIARMSNATSLIGIQLDSFSDMVSFCIAPALLIYEVFLKFYGLLGFAIGFLFVFFGVLRLAKYNVRSCEAKQIIPYFEGLPTTAAGGILASYMLMLELFHGFENGITRRTIPFLMKGLPVLFGLMPILMLALGILMVTKFRYVSFSKMKFSRRVSVRIFVMIIAAIFLIISYPESMIFIIFSLYVLSGVLEYIWRLYSLRKNPV